jgi:hypothetical protein
MYLPELSTHINISMLTMTQYTVPPLLLHKAGLELTPQDVFRTTINKPTGNFFYDPWEIADEFKDTVWQKIYDTLPIEDKGEARLIQLKPGECYQVHADIDDRYHLNLSGNNCYLINLDTKELTPLNFDGIWWEMNAGSIHSAANFGNRIRYQLVVRKLLNKIKLDNPISVSITIPETVDQEDCRFVFDQTISPWLNTANKLSLIQDFEYAPRKVTFKTLQSSLDSLKEVIPEELSLNV